MAIGRTPDTNIRMESDELYKSTLNADKFRDTFVIRTYIENGDSTASMGNTYFLDFNNEFLDTYKIYLNANCDLIQFRPRWKCRPNYLSYDMYGTQIFAYILLYINDKTSALDFDMDYVKVPTKAALRELTVANQRLYPDRSKVKTLSYS